MRVIHYLHDGEERQIMLGEQDCVFTVEYSVRCAQMAVYGLFDTGKKPLPMYQGHHDPVVLARAVQALNR